MLNGLFDLARPALLMMEPERAHELTLRSLERGLYPRQHGPDARVLRQSVMGLDFPNPIGIAAGFDKNARVPQAIRNIGFGFSEVGTVTPLPQPGNPRPRIFRLIRDRAVINRLGFNNEGHGAALSRLRRLKPTGIVGVNIGANKDQTDMTGDYVKGLEAFSSMAQYFMVNISSPNTPGLRDLQAADKLDRLLTRLQEARGDIFQSSGLRPPMAVKLAPDMAAEELPGIVEVLMSHSVDGICIANTTLSRDGLIDHLTAKESGGLSGQPLFEMSTRMLARVYILTEGKVPLIGVGGISSGRQALDKVKAGASLLQLYTGLVYEGAGLVGRIKSHLENYCLRHNIPSISEVTGCDARNWVD